MLTPGVAVRSLEGPISGLRNAAAEARLRPIADISHRDASSAKGPTGDISGWPSLLMLERNYPLPAEIA